MQVSAKEDLQSFKKVLFEYPKEYEKLQSKISFIDNEINDLLHFLELGNLKDEQLGRLAEDLQKATRKRREFKDRENELRKITYFIDSLNIQSNTVNKINNLIHRSSTLENERKNRNYKPRVRKDYEWMLNKV